jgi:hypothetical protein
MTIKFQGSRLRVEIIGCFRELLINTSDRELWIGRTRADGYPLGIASGVRETDKHRTSARFGLGFFLVITTRMVAALEPVPEVT